MRTFLINLRRRTDRRTAVVGQLRSLDIAFTLVDAIDAQHIPADSLAYRFSSAGPLGSIASGDKACMLSHLRALEMFLETGEPYAAILEDDIALSPHSREWLRDARWIPSGIDLVKLERFGPPSQCIVAADPMPVQDRCLIRLLSKHCGAASYIVSRYAAREILRHGERKMTLPIDHLLFNPNNSPLFETLMPWQLLPALCEQQVVVGGATDIGMTRRSERPHGLAFARREIIRAYYEFRRLPSQAASILAGRANLQLVRSDRTGV
jgi:glycosyl transferase family 25